MILYSIVPTEVVFAGNQSADESKCVEMVYKGEKVQVLPLADNRYLVNRLISTSPKAYLNPELQPGSIIQGLQLQNSYGQ